MPSKVTIIQRFETPLLRSGEFTVRLSGRTGQLNYLSPQLVSAIESALRDEVHDSPTGDAHTDAMNAQAKVALGVLKRDPSTLDWRWFRFKRRIYHPELGGKKTLVTAITPFDFTQMVFSRGRRGHQMVGFFHPKIISINRPPTKAEWLEAQTLAHIETTGQDPSSKEIKHFNRLYHARPPLGPEKQRWITLLWMPTDTIQGAEEIRHKADIISNTAVLTSRLLMKEGPKIAGYDQMKAQTENVLAWRRDIEQAVHKSNVSLMQESQRRIQLDSQMAMQGVPRFVPPVYHEFPQMPSAHAPQKRLNMPSMPDFGRFMPLLAIVVGIMLLGGGLWTYMQTANMPTRSGFDVAAFGGVIMLVGMVILWMQGRQGSPRRAPTMRPPQPPPQQPNVGGAMPPPEEREQHAS